MPIITIDGNIGCGKSTILNYIHKNNKIAIDLEPVEKWELHLKKLYATSKVNSYNFQIKVWLDRCWVQEKSDNILIYMERSPNFIKNVFVENAKIEKSITEEEYNTLHSLYKKTDDLWEPKSYIYLRSDPNQCYERCIKRGRESEKNITLEYITQIHKLHEENYLKAKDNIPIIVIDIENKSITDIVDEILRYNNI
jgi:deoxyadenosine/deoxycytidine kinase